MYTWNFYYVRITFYIGLDVKRDHIQRKLALSQKLHIKNIINTHQLNLIAAKVAICPYLDYRIKGNNNIETI